MEKNKHEVVLHTTSGKITISLQETNNGIERTWAPAPGFMIVTPLEADAQSPSGLILPESAQDNQNKGMVVAYIAEETKDAAFCYVGDIVLYSKFSAKKVKINDRELFFIARKDVYGVGSQE